MFPHPTSITIFSFFFLFLSFGALQLRVSGLGGPSWPIKFRQNAQTLPSIEVKLSPPDDPLPQVTAEILLLERARLDLEEGLMAKLEDEYNLQLDNAQTQIAAAVERAMSVFNNPDVLQGAIKGAVMPRSGETMAFKQIPSSSSSNKVLFTSFLQTGESVQSGIIGDIAAAVLAPPPAVKLQLTEMKEPDPEIKGKMDEIEQLRADEETKMFDQAMAEFGQLTRITVAELEKNIQIQMNPFLVDKKAVGKAMQLATRQKPELYAPPPLAFQEVETHPKETAAAATAAAATAAAATAAAAAAAAGEKIPMASFLQLGAAALSTQQARFGLATEKQLNVKIAQSEKPYPTIDEIVSEMEAKRDATERLERMKILQLQLKLLRAEGEMIKDALHTNVARVLAQFAPAIEAIKAEAAARALK